MVLIEIFAMAFDTTSSTMHQENYSIKSQVSNNNYTLFDKNLHRINENLKYVNQYYTPKYEHPVVNHSIVIESEKSNEPLDTKVDQPTNFFSEFYKITMNEIESKRKTNVRKILNNKAINWALKRKECSTTQSNNEELMRLVRERLAIDRNYNKELLDSNNDRLQVRLQEDQIILDKKKKNIKFAIALKNANSLLNDIKQLLSENHMTPQLFSNLMQDYMRFETGIKQFNICQNSNEIDLLAIDEFLQQIQIFNEQVMKSVLIKTQIENFSFSSDNYKNEDNKTSIENFTFNINENNTSEINHKFNHAKNEVDNFSFKIDKYPEVKSDEYITFNFKIDEKVVNSNTSQSSVNIEESKSNISYNFEDDYKQFLENHLSLQKYLKKIEKKYYSFLHQEDLKSLRQELIKSINTPINSISSVSSWHMKDKFEKIDALLKCKTVKTGNSTVSASAHPDALIFCKDTLAKKIINIGEQVASVKTETAFEVASIVTELWQIYPDFGELLYARFKQKCPCLIPYNAAKTNEETDEDFYKSLGYNYTNGVVEKHDKYVKRMTGIIRLFAAIIVTETKSGKALGIGQAWMLIAATVNLVPQLDVTAILLNEMLVITGYNLKQAYRKQFIKMLHYIDSNYMRKVDEITPIGCGGPVQRLKTFISKAIQVGYIEKPKGIIPNTFW